MTNKQIKKAELFSSPFIEERLYFENLSLNIELKDVLVPFYRGAVVFTIRTFIVSQGTTVLVPFYRGAVVFAEFKAFIENEKYSRPLLSRSGCIYD